ncbi:MAG: hypothetical protein SFX74_04820 [Fimbriimonadaceae bacterium]|nr:hypothetical protein [Fimbriimonadaceae bacterium]
MQTIRPNIIEISDTELGHPLEKGVVKVPDLGTVILDDADWNYITTHRAMGYEPVFFVSRAPAMGNDWVVVARRQKA